MKIVIPGGMGMVGRILGRSFAAEGHEVVALSRKPLSASWRVVGWDGETLGPWTDELDGADVIINLAGRSVNCRYNSRNRREILDSRVNSTRVLGDAICKAGKPPGVWLQASTATIYAHRFDATNDEMTGILGGSESGAPDTWNFSIDVATRWERALDEAYTPYTRRVKMRTAIVMSPDQGGPFDILLGLVRRGVGGKSGSGRQFVSWVHYRDLIRAVYWLVDRKDIGGTANTANTVNIAAPNPLPNAEFMRAIREAWGIRFGLPATEWMLELGAFFMGTETELILKSRRVVPGRLLEEGFQFEFETWSAAASDLVAEWRYKSKESAISGAP